MDRSQTTPSSTSEAPPWRTACASSQIRKVLPSSRSVIQGSLFFSRCWRSWPVLLLLLCGRSSHAAPIAAGDCRTCVITSTSGLRCWGYNDYLSLLGDSANTDMGVPSPLAVDVLTGVSSVGIGGGVNCALTVSGQLYTWGYGIYGNVSNSCTSL